MSVGQIFIQKLEEIPQNIYYNCCIDERLCFIDGN